MKVNVNNIIKYVAPKNRFLFGDYDEETVIFTGGRSSKKSTDFILMCIWDSFQDGDNILILRGTFNSHKETTHADFCRWIEELGLNRFFSFNMTELTIINKLTNGKILFKGADNPKSVQKLKGIIKLKKCFIEEANVGITQEIYRVIYGTMRNTKQSKKIYMAYNPLNPFLCPWKEWIDDPKKYNVIHQHSTYLENPFNDQAFRDSYARLKEINPRLYKTEALGEYGVYENAILDESKVKKMSVATFDDIRKRGFYQGLGIDFGCTHPQTLAHTYYDKTKNDLYIRMAIGATDLTNLQFHDRHMKNRQELKVIPNKFADSEDRASRLELNNLGWNFTKTYKLSMELIFIQFFNNLNNCYIVGDECDGFESNMASWCWKNGVPEGKNDDYVDAVRYSLQIPLKEKLQCNNMKTFSHDF